MLKNLSINLNYWLILTTNHDWCTSGKHYLLIKCYVNVCTIIYDEIKLLHSINNYLAVTFYEI